MQLIITKDGKYLELQDSVKIKANEFSVWFWEDFYNIDAKVLDNTKNIDLEKYSFVFEDFVPIKKGSN